MCESKIIVLGRWEGIIFSVDDKKKKFYAILEDVHNVKNKKCASLEAQFEFNDVHEGHQKFIKENSLFYYMIFDLILSTTKIKGASLITFKDYPSWESFNFEDISPEVESMHKAIFE